MVNVPTQEDFNALVAKVDAVAAEVAAMEFVDLVARVKAIEDLVELLKSTLNEILNPTP